MISFVIPLFNEQESLEHVWQEINQVMEGINEEYEIIFVDDGSTDRSLDILKQIKQENKNVRIFSFRKNQGKAEALSMGFRKAKGDYIITLDADLQDNPSEIPKLLEKSKESWDLVCGWRKERKDSLLKVLSSKLFNGISRFFWGLDLHDYNCGLKVYTRDAAKSIQIYAGLHRFIPLLVYQQGFRICEIAVIHQKRKFGKSKYGISKIFKDLPDLFTLLFLIKYGNRPFHFFGIVGFILIIIGLLILGYLSLLHFQGQTIGRRPLLFFGMLLVLSGFQVFFTGFLGDLFINLSYKQKTEKNKQEEFSLKYTSD